MNWNFTKPLEDERKIETFENIAEYTFPIDFRETVKKNNGASPEKTIFDTTESEECDFNRLLSFNENDSDSIWSCVGKRTPRNHKWTVSGLNWNYVPFAIDSFGNYICFDRTNNHVVFFDHEEREYEEIAESFALFIESLYEIDIAALYAKYMN